MSKALIIVDVQNDFCEGGALPVTGGNAVAEAIANDLIFKADYSVIAVTFDYHIDPEDHFAMGGTEPNFVDTWPVHCVAGERGSSLNPALAQLSSMRGAVDSFTKGEYSASYSGFDGRNAHKVPLAIWLRSRGVTEVDVVGLALDFCVKATALDAVKEFGAWKVTVLRKYTAPVSEEGGKAAEQELMGENVLIQH